MQAFAACRVRGWNLSWESLTSFSAREKLHTVAQEDPDFYQQLINGKFALPEGTEILKDELPGEDDDSDFVDDSDIPLPIVISCMVKGCSNDPSFQPEPAGSTGQIGRIQSIADAETLDNLGQAGAADMAADAEGSRRAKRVRTANRRYQSDTFWRHYDEDAWDNSDIE